MRALLDLDRSAGASSGEKASARTEFGLSAGPLHGLDLGLLLALEPIGVGELGLEYVLLEVGELVEDELEAMQVQGPMFVQIPAFARDIF